MSDILKGGKADNLTPEDLAKKHGISVSDIEKEVEIGMSIEKEHTPSKDKQREIAMDHISEFPDYYSNKRYGLVSTEKKLSKEDEVRKITNSFIYNINKMLDAKVPYGIDKFGDKLKKVKTDFGFYAFSDEYKTRVKDCLTDIISREEGISEKNFSGYDKIYDRIKDVFSRKTKINVVVNEFEKKGYRPEYCAEEVYAKFFV